MKIDTNEIKEWIKHDPEPETQAELSDLLTQLTAGNTETAVKAEAELTDRFQGMLQFGTAGLRGKMGAGPFRMNRAVVRKAAAGVTAWLKEKVGNDALVVIGYDARYHSDEFAVDTAAIVCAAGLQAKIMPRPLPTPLLAFAIRYLQADAGIMVTASHNPAQDNGYKVYLGNRAASADGNGVQIVPPVDGEIAAKIAATLPADEIPLAESGWKEIPEEVIEAYIEGTVQKFAFSAGASADIEEIADAKASTSTEVSTSTAADANSALEQSISQLKVIYTAMHGVGYETASRVFTRAGFANVSGVAEQIYPDPDFPTVAFPNPEELGALDLAIAQAEKENADIVIASDPDADRCSAAIPTADGWRQLSGDEIGAILGAAIARRAAQRGETGSLAASIVSSRLLAQIAQHHGLDYFPTLTGFKWIARAPHIIYGYEEAIGFCVNPQAVKDKDGISAGLALALLAAKLKLAGKTLLDALNEIYQRYGLYQTAPLTIRVEDLAIIPATMQKIRSNPPKVLADAEVNKIEDLAAGSATLPPTNAVKITTSENDQVIVRPSGTEPKIKCYLEVIVPLDESTNLETAKEIATARLRKLKADMELALKL